MKKIITICLSIFLSLFTVHADMVPVEIETDENKLRLKSLIIAGIFVLIVLIFSIICLKVFFKKEIDNKEIEENENAKESI